MDTNFLYINTRNDRELLNYISAINSKFIIYNKFFCNKINKIFSNSK